ncbi:hypothetical protein ATE59_00955 [Sphingopyxis sp. A083]|nr:hypothetical protein ATE59_00955 [Sphingopyxis sp. A083]
MADHETFTRDQFIDAFDACAATSSVPARQKSCHLPKIHPARPGLGELGDVTSYRYSRVAAPNVARHDSGRIAQDQDPAIGAFVNQYIAAPIVGKQPAAAIRQQRFAPDLLQACDAPTRSSPPEEMADEDGMLIDRHVWLARPNLKIGARKQSRPRWPATIKGRSRPPRDMDVEPSGHQIAKIG